jgi:hypothetical protein
VPQLKAAVLAEENVVEAVVLADDEGVVRAGDEEDFADVERR